MVRHGADNGPNAPAQSGHALVWMAAGLLFFLGGALASQTEASLQPALCAALSGVGMAVYVFGWWQSFRAKLNSDWFSRALNLLGLFFFLVLGSLLIYRMLAE